MDPYEILGVSASASDHEVRIAYRRLVKLHHPDHNNGSLESTRKFEEIQEAYSRVLKLREGEGSASPPPEPDPALDARLAELERELREAEAARERARRAAREAAATARPERPSDEELGYVTTDDSFGKILADAREEIFGRLDQAREHPAGRRVTDLIDELADKLTGSDRGR